MPTLTLDEIEIAALRLPEWDRLHVAEILLASLDNDENIRDAWVARAEQRAEEIERLVSASATGDSSRSAATPAAGSDRTASHGT